MKLCAEPQCPTLVPRGTARCALHEKQQRAHQAKRNSSAAGYGADWQAFRLRYAAKHPAICVECGAALPSRLMHLDHEPPLTGPDDPGRLDESRVRWMCNRHHSQKTARENGGFRHGH